MKCKKKKNENKCRTNTLTRYCVRLMLQCGWYRGSYTAAIERAVAHKENRRSTRTRTRLQLDWHMPHMFAAKNAGVYVCAPSARSMYDVSVKRCWEWCCIRFRIDYRSRWAFIGIVVMRENNVTHRMIACPLLRLCAGALTKRMTGHISHRPF